MEPARVGARVREQDDGGAIDRGFVALSRPVAHLPAIGRIAEDRVPAPVLAKAILVLAEEQSTSRILGGGARVEGKMKLAVEFGKERTRRWPLFRAASE